LRTGVRYIRTLKSA